MAVLKNEGDSLEGRSSEVIEIRQEVTKILIEVSNSTHNEKVQDELDNTARDFLRKTSKNNKK